MMAGRREKPERDGGINVCPARHLWQAGGAETSPTAARLL